MEAGHDLVSLRGALLKLETTAAFDDSQMISSGKYAIKLDFECPFCGAEFSVTGVEYAKTYWNPGERVLDAYNAPCGHLQDLDDDGELATWEGETNAE